MQLIYRRNIERKYGMKFWYQLEHWKIQEEMWMLEYEKLQRKYCNNNKSEKEDIIVTK